MADSPPAKRSSGHKRAASADTALKYAQLRIDQLADLDGLARELQAARTHKGERLTANTVIRVAIDVLLEHRDWLVGDTEKELRTSVLSRIKDLQQAAARHQPDETQP
jgi:hypothetical protein